jgi:hypothetical protein
VHIERQLCAKTRESDKAAIDKALERAQFGAKPSRTA